MGDSCYLTDFAQSWANFLSVYIITKYIQIFKCEERDINLEQAQRTSNRHSASRTGTAYQAEESPEIQGGDQSTGTCTKTRRCKCEVCLCKQMAFRMYEYTVTIVGKECSGQASTCCCIEAKTHLSFKYAFEVGQSF